MRLRRAVSRRARRPIRTRSVLVPRLTRKLLEPRTTGRRRPADATSEETWTTPVQPRGSVHRSLR